MYLCCNQLITYSGGCNEKNWIITIDGFQHQIIYSVKYGRKIIIDGVTYKLKSLNPFMHILDFCFSFGNTICNLVVIGSKADLAINGFYLERKKPYVHLQILPSWINILIYASVLVGFLGGPLGFLIGYFMSIVYVKLDMEQREDSIIGCFITCTFNQVILILLCFKLYFKLDIF